MGTQDVMASDDALAYRVWRGFLDRGIRLEAQGGEVIVAAGHELMTDAGRAVIERHRAALVALLTWTAADDLEAGADVLYNALDDARVAGYIPAALAVPADVRALATQAAVASGGAFARTCRLAGRLPDGADVATAALLAAHEEVCGRLDMIGRDALVRRSAAAVVVAEGAREGGGT